MSRNVCCIRKDINAILDNAERQYCNIRHGTGTIYSMDHHCHVCHTSIRRVYDLQFISKQTARCVMSRHGLCSVCVDRLYQQHDKRLAHTFEMYKAIRCIHSDVAKYMLKFVFIPSIIGHGFR